jgi:diguanylate cyclase (GGDEF)-like protein
MLQQAIDNAAVRGTSVAVIFIDLDRFKQINDTSGHAAGDEALQQIARRFEAVAGSRMTVGRLGGDEFAVVLPDVRSRDEAMRAGIELTRALDAPLELSGEKRHVGASFGVALFPEDESIASALLVKADAAMYRSKHSAGSSGDKSLSARAGHRG